MKAILFSMVLFLISVYVQGAVLLEDQGGVSTDVGVNSRYNYNVFYTSENPTNDFSLNLTPSILARTKPKYFYIEGEGHAAFEKYMAQSVQDHLDYTLTGKIALNEGGINSFFLNLKQSAFSDPAFTSSYSRINHLSSSAEGLWQIKTEKGNQVKLSGKYKTESITVPSYAFNKNYLNHYNVDASGEYDIKFLPETFWFLRGSSGIVQYTSPTLDPALISQYVAARGATSIKTNSQYYMGELGINGRLTDKTSVDAATGFLTRLYPNDDSFISPVFYLHFVEQVTRRDQLIAGYNYYVEDAYSTNYFLNQEIYIGLARVMGDQLLILSEITYEYKNYSNPLARNDQRIAGGLTVKYSMRSNFKLTADIKVDLLASDAYDTSLAPVSPDRAVSYKSGSMGIGFVSTF